MAKADIDTRWNRDQELKPDRPDRSAYEPKGAEGSEVSDKTATDPASGQPTGRPPAPNRARSDERPAH